MHKRSQDKIRSPTDQENVNRSMAGKVPDDKSPPVANQETFWSKGAPRLMVGMRGCSLLP